MNYQYLAGIVDGEGTIGITSLKSKIRFSPFISISNTNKQLLNTILEFLKKEGFNACISTKKPRKENHKTCYSLTIKDKYAIKLAKILKNELLIKAEQATLLAENYEICTPRNGKYNSELLVMKNNLISKIKSLNSRGI